MNVILSPNIKKQSARIDLEGNEIDPKTKQVLVPNKPDYVPTAQDLAGLSKPGNSPATVSTGSSELDAKIEAKVELYRKELIEKAKAALDNL